MARQPNNLWVEKYRPDTLDGYVLKNAALKTKIENWYEEGTIPHLLIHGPAGTGKTTLAKIIMRKLDPDFANVKEINASRNNGVDYIRNTIEGYASTMPFMADYNYILLDEADHLSPEAQATMRNLMETYSDQTRFILTCNYPHKIIPALKSRCQEFVLDKPDYSQFQERAVTVLLSEGVDIPDADVLSEYIDGSYPDLRKCLNLLQQNTIGGKLVRNEVATSGTSDWQIEALEKFRSKDFEAARKVICSNIKSEDYDAFWTFLYKNVDIWADGDLGKMRNLIITIRNGMFKAPHCADQELNLSATLIEMELIAEG